MHNKINKPAVVTLVGILLIIVFSIWKAQYGFYGQDFSYYITVPYRAAHDDILFWHEWIPQQAFLLPFIPLVKAYLTIIGSTEGIMYASKILYLFISVLLSLIIYRRIRHFGYYASIVVWVYLLFVPFNQMALFYSNIGSLILPVGIVYFATAKKYRDYFISGLCYAIATVCQPVLALLFIIFSIFFLVRCIYKKQINNIKKYFLFLSACLCAAIPYIYYFVIHVGIIRFSKSFNTFMTAFNKEHNYSSIWNNPIKYLLTTICYRRIISLFGLKIDTAYIVLMIIVVWILLVFIFILNHLFWKKETVTKILILLSIISVCLYTIICCINTIGYYFTVNIVWLGWIIVGILCYKGQNDQINKKIYIYSLIISFACSISFLTTNVGGHIFGIAIFPSCLFTFLLLHNNDYIISNNPLKKISLIVIVICICCSIYIKTTYFLFDSFQELKYTINKGPGKYTKVSKKTFKEYNHTQQDISNINYKNKNIVLITLRPYVYLFVDESLAQNSMWLEQYDKGIQKETIELIEKYKEIHPEKQPDIVYVSKEDLTHISINGIINTLKLQKYHIAETNTCWYIYRNQNDIK